MNGWVRVSGWREGWVDIGRVVFHQPKVMES